MLLERSRSIIVTCERPVEVLIPSSQSLVIQTDMLKDGTSTVELIENASQMNADIIAITTFDERPETAQAIMTAAVSSLVIVECIGNDEVDSLRRFHCSSQMAIMMWAVRCSPKTLAASYRLIGSSKR